MKKIKIMGIRGIPARHGGFETFTEDLALYLASKDWEVSVYCQCYEKDLITELNWNGVRLIQVPVKTKGPLGTIIFDWKSTLHASSSNGLILTLGYNTALFCLVYRLKRMINIINMDGIEWKRSKWSIFEKIWLYLNELLGCWFGNHLIADHPRIKVHLATRVSSTKITMIPYGAPLIKNSDPNFLLPYDLIPYKYFIVIARPEPENSLLEIVSAYSRNSLSAKLVIVGHYEPDRNKYHRKVIEAGNGSVKFIGSIYDKQILSALRYFAKLYIHGHTVGGTNPSLVEALGAGLPILAHDNEFNSWVAGNGALYFKNEEECANLMKRIHNNDEELDKLKRHSIIQFSKYFSLEKNLKEYEKLLRKWTR